MTMVMMTALAMTRERERGTMENLLATPVRPFEVMAGKIVPYILIGYVQVVVILVAAKLLFQVPMVGSLPLLSAIVPRRTRVTSAPKRCGRSSSRESGRSAPASKASA